jgi:hypothetical protein
MIRRTLRSNNGSVLVVLVLVAAIALTALVFASAGPTGSALAGKPSPTPTATPTAPPLPTFPLASKAWTVMVYIDGDNSLETYVTKDIDTELSALGSNANVNVVCLADRGTKSDPADGGWTSTKLFYCQQGMTALPANAVADWGERNMGDPQTLRDFVNWTKTNCPASKYMLAFWDHGYMWFPHYWNTLDDTSADSLDDDEQVAAMATVGGVNVVAWDQCQRQMIEVAANWQPYAQAMAGSEQYTNWEGIQYDQVIAAIRTTPTMTAQQVSDKTASTALGDSLTYSSMALDTRFTTLKTAVDQWAIALKAGLPIYKSAYSSAWTATQKYTDASEKDLYDAAFQLKAKVADVNIKTKCDAVMAAVTADVTVNWTNGSSGVSRAHGVAIWYPNSSRMLHNYAADHLAYYQTTLNFGVTTNWDEFLVAFCQ